jgi:hypothetical protein
MPYGMDVLARDYAHVGKKKLCTFGGPGDGPMQLQEPTGLTITDRESILVADTLNHRIVEWMVQRRQGNMVKKFGSKGKSTGEFRNPQVHTYSDIYVAPVRIASHHSTISGVMVVYFFYFLFARSLY